MTGGSTGIGRATSLAFARQGATVVIGDVDERSAETVELIEQAGGRGSVRPHGRDGRLPVEALVKTAVDSFGGLHARSTTRACSRRRRRWPRWTRRSGTRCSPSTSRAPSCHSSTGSPTCSRPAGRHRQHGFGGRPHRRSGHGAYVAAKHGVVGLTRAAAIDYAKHGIRVNALALAPGLVETPMTQRWLEDPVMREAVVAGSQMGRPARPEEMAGMVLFLASPLASFATGGVYAVDAGQTAH